MFHGEQTHKKGRFERLKNGFDPFWVELSLQKDTFRVRKFQAPVLDHA
jgi:hypothetical protein